jgi:ubiquinone/menaquinone biosynthesis C-methylase UbiE
LERDPIKRFSGRAENYEKYRPSYPKEVLMELKTKISMTNDKIIVEIGSGTGKLSKILLEEGYKVYAVEPNDEMRNVAEKLLNDYRTFTSINGRAENTTLESNKADFIITAQAIHWFEPTKSLKEFHRILKPDGKLAVIWNQRDIQGSILQKKYEEILLKFSPEYRKMPHRNLDKFKMAEYIEPSSLKEYRCRYSQILTFAEMKGRLDSTSYVPKKDHHSYPALMNELDLFFKNFELNGKIEFPYVTRLFYGDLK